MEQRSYARCKRNGHGRGGEGRGGPAGCGANDHMTVGRWGKGGRGSGRKGGGGGERRKGWVGGGTSKGGGERGEEGARRARLA